jgi:hypothetical protein
MEIPAGPLSLDTAKMIGDLLTQLTEQAAEKDTSSEVQDYVVWANVRFMAQLLEVDDNLYSWQEMTSAGPIGFANWVPLDGGRTGSLTINPAVEANGNNTPVDSIVPMRRYYLDATYDWVYVFDGDPGYVNGSGGTVQASSVRYSGAKVYSSSTQSIADSTPELLIFTDAAWDTDSYWDGESTLRPNQDGIYYDVFATVGWSQMPTSASLRVTILVNNTVAASQEQYVPAGWSGAISVPAHISDVEAGGPDTGKVQLLVYQNTGGALSTAEIDGVDAPLYGASAILAIHAVGGIGVGTADSLELQVEEDAVQGTPLAFTLLAIDSNGFIDMTYSGTVEFTCSDASATLPADATLTDGVGIFDVTFETLGTQTITATDTASAAITGSAAITVLA